MLENGHESKENSFHQHNNRKIEMNLELLWVQTSLFQNGESICFRLMYVGLLFLELKANSPTKKAQLFQWIFFLFQMFLIFLSSFHQNKWP